MRPGSPGVGRQDTEVADMARERAKDVTQGSNDEIQLVVFALADEAYGVEVLKVEEIIRYQEITAIPHAPEFVKGVTNLRGRIVPIVDLRDRFGLAVTDVTKATRIVVVEASSTTVGLIVDSVDEVRNLPVKSIEPPSPIVTTVDSDFLTGVGKLSTADGKQQLIILLDLNRIVADHEVAALPPGADEPARELAAAVGA